MDLHHPLLSEFPEYRVTILSLKAENMYFREMFDEYHQIDDEIVRIEEEQTHASDRELESLKMRRVLLKDALFHELRVSAEPQLVH